MSTAFSPQSMDGTHKMNLAATLRGVLVSLAVNALPAVVIYIVLVNFVHTATMTALIVSAIPSIAYALIEIARKQRVDLMSAFTVVVIALGVALALMSGNPRLYLLRSSLISIAIGAAYLISLLFPRPLWFYVGRHFLTGNDPQNIARFNAQWQYPHFRFAMRFMSLVWGVSTLVFVVIHVVVILTLPIVVVLLIGDVVSGLFFVFLLGWTGWYVRRMLKKLDEVRRGVSIDVAEQAKSASAS